MKNWLVGTTALFLLVFHINCMFMILGYTHLILIGLYDSQERVRVISASIAQVVFSGSITAQRYTRMTVLNMKMK